METTCTGCQNKHKTRDESLNGRREHVCKCRSPEEKITIEAGLDQTAVTSGDEEESATGPAGLKPRKIRKR